MRHGRRYGKIPVSRHNRFESIASKCLQRVTDKHLLTCVYQSYEARFILIGEHHGEGGPFSSIERISEAMKKYVRNVDVDTDIFVETWITIPARRRRHDKLLIEELRSEMVKTLPFDEPRSLVTFYSTDIQHPEDPSFFTELLFDIDLYEWDPKNYTWVEEQFRKKGDLFKVLVKGRHLVRTEIEKLSSTPFSTLFTFEIIEKMFNEYMARIEKRFPVGSTWKHKIIAAERFAVDVYTVARFLQASKHYVFYGGRLHAENIRTMLQDIFPGAIVKEIDGCSASQRAEIEASLLK